MQKQQSADTNVLIGRYRLSADYRCISKHDYFTLQCNHIKS